jgi:hypothetical protein
MSSNTQDERYITSENRNVEAAGTSFAYRDLGSGEVPLVLLQHFRGNLDNWDPSLIDALALVLTQTRRDPDQLRVALDAAYAYLRSFAA